MKKEQVLKYINDLAEFSQVTPIAIMESIISKNPKSPIIEIMNEFIVKNNTSSGIMDSETIRSLCQNGFTEFREYFKNCNEESKLNILSTIPGYSIPLLVDDYSYIDGILEKIPDKEKSILERNRYHGLRIGEPMSFFRSLGLSFMSDYSLDISKQRYNREAEIKFKTVETYAPFYFKYIELGQIKKGTIYHDIRKQLMSEDTNSLVMKCIIKRIEMYDQKKIAKVTLRTFIDFINTNRVSNNNRNLIMNTLNEYVPTKIMMELTL